MILMHPKICDSVLVSEIFGQFLSHKTYVKV
jgi:hypothetical protein